MKFQDLLNNTTTKRNTLKPAFNLGEIPTPQNFYELIDSLFLLQGDTIYKDANSGLGIQVGTDIAKTALLFYDDPAQEPAWTMSIKDGWYLNDTSSTTRLAVKTDGEVGIGTTSPGAKLQITAFDNTNAGLMIGTPNTQFVNFDIGIYENTRSNPSLVVYSEGSNAYTFYVGEPTGADLFWVRGDGNGFFKEKLGLGTADPQERLHVQHNQNATYLSLDNTKASDAYVGMSFKTSNQNWGIFSDRNITNQGIGIYKNSGGTGSAVGYLLTVTGDGNVGLGTTNPQSKLHVVNGDLLLQNESGDGYPILWLKNVAGTSTLRFDYNAISQIGQGLLVRSNGNNIYINDNGGNVGIGVPWQQSIGYKLEVNGDINIKSTDIAQRSGILNFQSVTGDFARIYSEKVAENTIRLILEAGDDGGADHVVIRNRHYSLGNHDVLVARRNDVSINGNLHYSGSLTPSDASFKKDIQSIPEDIIASLYKLKGKTYQYRTEEFKEKGFNEGIHLGFIAQELQEAYPHLVSEDIDGYLAINYQGLIPILIEASKQQQQRIEVLESLLKSSK